MSRWYSWIAGHLGIVPRLVLASLFTLLLAIAALGTFTLDTSAELLGKAAELQLGTNMVLLKEQLRPLGTEWRLEGDTLTLGGHSLSGRDDVVDAVRRVGGGRATIFAGDLRVATNVVGSDGRRAVGTRLAAGMIHDAVLGRGERFEGVVPILGRDHLAIYEPVRDAAGAVAGCLAVVMPLAELHAPIVRVARATVIAALGLAVVATLLNYLALKLTLRPLVRLAATTRALAGGDLSAAVPGSERHDQLGDLARALVRLRDGAATARRLEEQAMSARAESERLRNDGLRAMADQVEAESSLAVDRVATEMERVSGAADEMARSAVAITNDSDLIAGAAQQTLADTQSVADAVEQLSASVRVIAAQVSSATAATQQAVAEAKASGEAISALSDTVGTVSGMTRLIADIAAQTNLLALNATIEAARAGEAGRGFTVVADEVKSLAKQTASATGDITRQIGAIRAAMTQAIEKVSGIGEIVAEVDVVAAAIASAVERQSVATQEISRAVSHTATGAAEMTRRLAAVAAETNTAGDRAAEVRAGAEGGKQAVAMLRRDLVRVIRNAAPEVDRREFARYDLPMDARLRDPGGSFSEMDGMLLDISATGARLTIAPGQTAPARVQLVCPALLPEPLSADVLESRVGELRLRFRLDPAAQDQLARSLEAQLGPGQLVKPRASARELERSGV